MGRRRCMNVASSLQQSLLLVEQSSRIMATNVSVHLAVPPAEEASAQAAIETCMNWLREVERRLTRFDPASELSQLNEAAGEWRPASELLFSAMREALRAAEASAGLFDPALLPQLQALGYDRDFAQLARHADATTQTGSAVPVSTGSWRGIQMDARGRRIRLPEGTRLDLGGIAKGWAADMTLKRSLRAFPNVIVNVGGDLRLRGERSPGEPWAVGIRDPRYDHLPGPAPNIAVFTFHRGRLATSGATSRWWYHGGQRQHHLLDPRTGRPVHLWMQPDQQMADTARDAGQLIATATALAPTAARAEVAAKVALLRGYPGALNAVEAAWEQRSERGMQLLPADRDVALLLVMGNGDVLMSRNMEAYLETCGGGGMVWA